MHPPLLIPPRELIHPPLMQFREPLGPSAAPWSPRQLLAGLGPWTHSQRPFTLPIQQLSPPSSSAAAALSPLFAPEAQELLAMLLRAKRGLLVVGELMSPADAVTATRLAGVLGWPVAADVLSGMRVGATAAPDPAAPSGYGAATDGGSGAAVDDSGGSGACHVIHHMDQLLLGDKTWWACLKPDVVLQVGAHGTSKRLAQFMVSGEGQSEVVI